MRAAAPSRGQSGESGDLAEDPFELRVLLDPRTRAHLELNEFQQAATWVEAAIPGREEEDWCSRNWELIGHLALGAIASNGGRLDEPLSATNKR